MSGKMDWDRVNSEKRMLTHGSEGIEENHQGGDGPLGLTTDAPFWPIAHSGKPRDLNRSDSAKENQDGESYEPALVMFFNLFVSESKNDASMQQCSDLELRECRDTCQSISNRLSGLTWSSEKVKNTTSARAASAAGGVESRKDSTLNVFLRIIDGFSKNDEQLSACTSLEIQGFREICQSMWKRANLQILKRENARQSSR